MRHFPQILLLLVLFVMGCDKDSDPLMLSDDDQVPVDVTDRFLKIKLRFDPTQERLDNFGNPATMLPSHASQTPSFNTMSAHFIELVPTELTPYQEGAFIFKGEEVPADNPNSYGFTSAIDFDKAVVVEEEELFLEIPLAEIDTGVYQHIRVSVSYQNYEVLYNLNNVPIIGSLPQQSGTVASFVGYNTTINNLTIKDMELEVNGTKLQGFWGFETSLESPYSAYNQIFSEQAPADATTVVNPFPNAPVPKGSCVVSGSFNVPLEVTWKEEEDIEIVLSLSINGSFEWEDDNGNGEWDIDAENTAQSERVVDMGLRGLKAFIE